jgi:hypothetical protein
MPAAVGGGSKVPAYTTGVVHRPSWGKAIEVPGTAALNKGGDAQITSISCASAGNCSAGGLYANRAGKGMTLSPSQAFVVTEKRGTWGKAIEVPGTAAVNKGGGAQITSVSCAPAGDCSAGGFYAGSTGQQAFVVNEKHGTWGKAIEVPGSRTLNKYRNAGITSVSCTSAGNCSAGGFYANHAAGITSPPGTQAFVVSEKHGTWGKAIEVPGTAAFDHSDFTQVSSVSCTSAGNCSAAGGPQNTSRGPALGQAFVVSEKHGTWGKAIEVPGIAALNTAGYAVISSVSCGSAGNCGAGGQYQDNGGAAQEAFVVNEVNGTWGKAIEAPGTAALNIGTSGYAPAGTTSLSCPSAGDCKADGYYTDSSGNGQAFVVSEVNGTWRTAEEVPGTAALNAGGGASIQSVSCASTGNCSAGGSYADRSNHAQAFVVGEG